MVRQERATARWERPSYIVRALTPEERLDGAFWLRGRSAPARLIDGTMVEADPRADRVPQFERALQIFAQDLGANSDRGYWWDRDGKSHTR